ncbi:collagen binding domain-containing protein [Streptococcus ratti]|uniref:collagen binding domain-containing protein n=1 Tax=Streptococcus ratti TaxID=1341 RepID=UPI0002BEB67D|nr:collagen binding domain-containing protein [Streptococcus ratti]EMP71162.1 cell wall-associated protein precursor [Streptococcus ratti FA-1 = DSM 20564]QEY07753.1 LPXTG cell wall anchor domain-containing protein [Streptococcus ratti]VEI60215.1 cell wall-associated protein [Streptococcus mutans]
MKMKWKLLGLISIITMLVGAFWMTKAAKADQVTNYANTSSITKSDGTPLSADSSIRYWEPLAVNNSITFPDEVSIKAGDTLTLKLPEQLRFTTALTFDVLHSSGQLAGKAVTDPATQEVTVTFTDIFEKLPQDKEMSLNFNVQVNHDNITSPGTLSFTYNGVAYTTRVEEKEITPISPAVYKTGYQDSSDPSIIHWQVLINSKQAAIDNLTLTDVVGEGQEIIKDSLLAARLQYIEGDDVDSLDEAASRPYAEDFSKNLSYQTNNTGSAVGFTYTFGSTTNNAIFISYNTRLTKSQSVGNDMANTIAISGNNVNYSNTVGYARIESAYGKASSRQRRELQTTTTVAETTTSDSSTTKTEATTESSTAAETTTTTKNNTTTEEATTTTGNTLTTTEIGTTTSKTTTNAQTSSTTVGGPLTTNTMTTAKETVKRKVRLVLPSTGEQAGLWLTAIGLVIVIVAGVYFYRTRR